MDKFGIHRALLTVFLKKFGDAYELDPSDGRHILHGEPSRILPVGTNRKNVYDTYVYGWQFLLSTPVLPRSGAIEPLGPFPMLYCGVIGEKAAPVFGSRPVGATFAIYICR